MAAASTVIDDLPEEVLLIIFSKLTVEDRKSVRLVNKYWLDVCNSPSITKDELVKLYSTELIQLKTHRGCLNMEIYNETPYFSNAQQQQQQQQQQEEFWVVHGGSVRHLVVKIYRHNYTILYQIINHCSNVEHLILEFNSYSPAKENYDDTKNMNGMNTKLDCLMSLTLSGGLPWVLAKLSFPKLKRLVLNSMYDLAGITPLIVKHAVNLTELDLKFCRFQTDSLFDELFEQIGPQLTGLYLPDLTSVSTLLSKHAVRLSSLKCLEFYWGSSLPKPLPFKTLEFISFHHADVYDEDIIPLVALANLKGLNISWARCTAAGLLKCFGRKVLSKMIALVMVGLTFVTDDILSAILPNLQNLKMLHLGYSGITTEGVQVIVTNCKQLTHLSLEFCAGIENMPANINSLEHLVNLELSCCRKLNPRCVLQLRFDKLESIELGKIWVPKGRFKELFQNCPRLQRAFFQSFLLERVHGGGIERVPIQLQLPAYYNIFDFSK